MRRLLPLALAALLALTLLPGLSAIGPIDAREARDAEIVRESTTGHEWVTPVYEHQPFFEQPLFAYAPELAAQRLFARLATRPADPAAAAGESRAARSALAATLALLVAVIGARAFGARAGWLGGCALASTVGLPLATRADGGQLLATLAAWFAIGLLLQVLQGRARAPVATRWAAWAAIGVAALAGGPLPALWPVGGFALYFALARAHRGWREIRPGLGLLVAAGIALPWYGVMAAIYRGHFLARVPWFPYATAPRAGGLSGLLMALSYPMVIGWPWSPVLAASLRDTAQRLGRGGESDLRDGGHAASLLLCLMVAACVPVALYPRAPLTAALPALPAIALLCGRFLDRALDGDIDPRLLGGATRMAAVLGTALSLLAVVAASRLADAAPGLRLLAATLLLASWAPLLADLLGRRKAAAALFALPIALAMPIVSVRVLPALEPWLGTRAVAEAMNAVAPPRAPLVLLEPAPPSLRLLLARNVVVVRDLAGPLVSEAASDGNVYAAFPPALERDVARTSPAPLEILTRTPTLVLARVGVAPRLDALPAGPAPAR